MKTKDILELINRIAPFDIAEDWDNSGLQVGNPDWEVKKVMIGLDVSMALMTAAGEAGCHLVLTHHPLMIQPEKTIDFSAMPGCAIEMAATQKISILSAHTNLDKAIDGLNDYFAAKIGLVEIKPFLVESPAAIPAAGVTGIGRIGSLESPARLSQVVHQIKERLGLTHVRVTGNLEAMVETIAVCTGSGGSLVDAFLESGADVYITGDIKYHEARQVEEYEKTLIDVGHFGSEHMAVDLLSDRLGRAAQEAGINIQIEKFKKENDPFIIV